MAIIPYSDLLELLGLDHWVRLRDLLPTHPLEVELASVVFWVTVRPAECQIATTLEPRETHAPLACHTSIWFRLGLRLQFKVLLRGLV